MPDQTAFYRDLLDNLADGIYFTDLEGRITYWNEGTERLSGFSRSEVQGKLGKNRVCIDEYSAAASIGRT